MTYGLSPEELALKAEADAFGRSVVSKRGVEIDQTREYPWDVGEAMRGQGFLGMTIPTEYGGQGRSFLDTVLVV